MADLLAQRGLGEFRQWLARVNPGSGDGTLTIAVGTSEGVAAGQTAVVGVHVVGRIVEPIGSGTATVALVTRIGDRLRVSIRPPAQATARADAAPIEARVRLDPDRGAFVAEDLPVGATLEAGDVVYLADDLNFSDAQGFQLGRITRVEPLPSDPLTLQRISIEPALDLPRLDRLTVLIPPEAGAAAGGFAALAGFWYVILIALPALVVAAAL